jgi:hypothetical protein
VPQADLPMPVPESGKVSIADCQAFSRFFPMISMISLSPGRAESCLLFSHESAETLLTTGQVAFKMKPHLFQPCVPANRHNME